jgi:hypothetical protein
MRIIKKGKLPELRLYRATCKRCSTEFEFLGREAKKQYDERERESLLSIDCPVCNTNLFVREHPDSLVDL